jgi:hypothetical protein
VAEGDNGGGLLVIEIDDLFIDVASSPLCPPLPVLADKGDVGVHLPRRPLPSRRGIHLREMAHELEGAPLSVIIGDEVL